MTSYKLWTCNYARFNEDMGTPIQISNSRPKYRLNYELRFAMKGLAPKWSLIKANLPHADFESRYREALDLLDIDHLKRLFEQAAEVGGREDLVLLCFENTLKPGNWCHRDMFARWWTDRTGEQVQEVPIPRR